MIDSTSKERKIMYMHMSKKMAQQNDSVDETPDFFIGKLSKKTLVMVATLESLSVALRNNSVSFVTEFVDKKGIDLLCNNLLAVQVKKAYVVKIVNNYYSDDIDRVQQLVLCLQAVINTVHGMTMFLQQVDFIYNLPVLALQSYKEDGSDWIKVDYLRIQIIYLMTVLCFYSMDG